MELFIPLRSSQDRQQRSSWKYVQLTVSGTNCSRGQVSLARTLWRRCEAPHLLDTVTHVCEPSHVTVWTMMRSDLCIISNNSFNPNRDQLLTNERRVRVTCLAGDISQQTYYLYQPRAEQTRPCRSLDAAAEMHIWEMLTHHHLITNFKIQSSCL